ncbi:Z-ring formation inhibitor MciZ [Paenibacillus algorifonticola]
MKTYTSVSHLRLVGKAWEIRHQLRLMSCKAASGASEPLASFLTRIST